MTLETAAPVQSAAGQQFSAPSDERILKAVLRFTDWLNRYGETSYDFQTFYASELGRRAKALYYKQATFGTLAVAPIIFSEAFVPSARRIFWKRQRFPIADAHYAMGFAPWHRLWNKISITRRRSISSKSSKTPDVPVITTTAGAILSTGRPYAAPLEKERR